MFRKTAIHIAVMVALGLLQASGLAIRASVVEETAEAEHGREVSGSFAPVGPPLDVPVKTDAGQSCVVDITQAYSITGALSGSLEISYRILVAGPCGSPPGTFDEEWIAHGSFVGTVDGSAASADLSYVARVEAGGDVTGRIALGHGLDGDLRVSGNFGEGQLTYRGRVE